MGEMMKLVKQPILSIQSSNSQLMSYKSEDFNEVNPSEAAIPHLRNTQRATYLPKFKTKASNMPAPSK